VEARNPSDRSVIAFAAWSSFAHGVVMAVMAVHLSNERGDLLIAAAAFGVIAAVMTVLAPAKQAAGLVSTTGQAIGLYFIGSPATSIHSVEAHAAIQPLNGSLK
jgi:uncharacterized membrane protein HdeD (DUF308 family)